MSLALVVTGAANGPAAVRHVLSAERLDQAMSRRVETGLLEVVRADSAAMGFRREPGGIMAGVQYGLTVHVG